jgi:hypothetical protein
MPKDYHYYDYLFFHVKKKEPGTSVTGIITKKERLRRNRLEKLAKLSRKRNLK